MKTASAKRASTFFLKAVILFIGIAVFTLCALLFPPILRELRTVPEFTAVFYPGLFAFYATAIPFFFALYQSWKLLRYIDANNAFSEFSIQALRKIKYCAVAMSILYATNMPLVVLLSELDDAPGGIIIGFVIVLAPLTVATFAAVLQKLVQNAIDIKTENDFTV